MATSTFEHIFTEQAAPQAPSEPTGRNQRPNWLLSWDEWLTLILVVLLQVPVIGSLESANWVDEMPSLAAASAFGVAAGWLLAQSRLQAVIATGAGLIGAFLGVIGLVLYTMERVDVELGEGVRGAWTEFWLRMRDWGAALWEGGISADPMPFVVLMVAMVFVVAYLSAWSVVRWRNPWAALVPGGIVLLTNISYLPGQPSIAFVIFVFAAVLLVSRLYYLRSRERWEARQMYSPESMSSEILGVAAAIALLLIAFAWLVPTANNWGPVSDAWNSVTAPVQDRVDGLGNLFIGIASKHPMPIHSYGSTLPIQGSVSLDNEPLFEVYTEEPGLLRGAVYDEYTGSGWRMSETEQQAFPSLGISSAQLGTAETRATVRSPITTEIHVVGESVPEDILLLPGDPLAADVESSMLLGPLDEPLGLVPERSMGEGSRYTTVGTISVAAVPTLQEAGTDYPASLYERYTALPDDLPPEVHELAETVVAGSATPYEAARRVEMHLRDHYEFTMSPAAPAPRRDAVAHFLFDEPEGYFDHFASAMTVMLRSSGVPARVSVGFVLDDRDFDDDLKAFVLSERRAWAWPEVYFPGLGWVEFNPTPSMPTIDRPGDDAEALAERDEEFEGGMFGDDFFLDDYFLDLLAEEYGGVGGDIDVAIDTEEPGEGGGVSGVVSTILTALLVFAAGVLALILLARFWWERGFRKMPPAMRRWAKVQRLAGWAGAGARSHRTPVEAAGDLSGVTGEATALRSLAQVYTRGRYGGPAGAAAETEAEARERDEHYRRVRGTLWKLVLRRLVLLGREPAAVLARRNGVTGDGIIR